MNAQTLTRKLAWMLDEGDVLPLPDGTELIVGDMRATGVDTIYVEWIERRPKNVTWSAPDPLSSWSGEVHPNSEWYVR